MTTHELARKLLEGPDCLILAPINDQGSGCTDINGFDYMWVVPQEPNREPPRDYDYVDEDDDRDDAIAAAVLSPETYM